MKKEASVEFYLTFDMIGDYFTKHYRDLNSVDSATSFLVSKRMTFQPTTHPEKLYTNNEN